MTSESRAVDGKDPIESDSDQNRPTLRSLYTFRKNPVFLIYTSKFSKQQLQSKRIFSLSLQSLFSVKIVSLLIIQFEMFSIKTIKSVHIRPCQYIALGCCNLHGKTFVKCVKLYSVYLAKYGNRRKMLLLQRILTTKQKSIWYSVDDLLLVLSLDVM